MPAERTPLRTRMTARAVDEPHRTASPLELLFDLTLVVAVAAATAELAHSIEGGHLADGVLPFLEVFFAIWWAWMNFTWFASSYATDDVAYRLLTMVQMGGVLVIAAGIPEAAKHSDFRWVALGYVIMRLALVAQWLRAAAEDPTRRRTALRYAIGISVAQVGWLLSLVLTGGPNPPVFLVLVVLELSVPRWAERTYPTNWHPHHIAERYGLFTLILLGESVLAATRGVQNALAAGEFSGSLLVVAGAGLVLLFALWWFYFQHPAGECLSQRRNQSYRWGYGHYGVFASLAALGAGLEVAVQTGHEMEVSPVTVGYSVSVPAAAFIVLLWAVHKPIEVDRVIHPALILCAAAVLAVVPLTAEQIGVPAVVVVTAAVCSLVAVVAGQPVGSSPGVTRPHS
ncbi:low temperature requirement protein A [Kribbella sp. NPDC049227]|uniref:low temperature requirement protein A n=1 Tax=Kribbella sp. NPDC049227 TaxID=3364113 RepID=UPI00371941B3